MSKVGDLITKNYSNFRGIDLQNKKDDISQYRSPDSKNMWRNYAHDNCIESRPQLIALSTYFDNGNQYKYTDVRGAFFYFHHDDYHLVVHAGTKLYDNDSVVFEGLENGGQTSFVVVGKNLYIKSQNNFHMYNGTSVVTVESIAYIPKTSMSRTPVASATDTAGGTHFQDVNLMTPKRKNTFTGDGTNAVYPVDAENIDSDFIEVKVNGEIVTNYTVNWNTGKVTFTSAPPAPLTVGEDNVEITYKKAIAGSKEKILKCTMMTPFDNRLFFSGNPENQNKLYHCSTDTDTGLADPTYISDLDYYTDGVDDSAIVSMVAGSNCLWVFKSESQTNTTIFYHTPTTDSDYGKIYPSAHSNISTGCDSFAVNFNDDIVFMSKRGLEAITSNLETEQVLTHRSTFVDAGLLNEGCKPMFAEWDNRLLVAYQNRVYVADGKAKAQFGEHTEYEWFMWEFDKPVQYITCTKDMLLVVIDGEVFTMDAIYDREYNTEKFVSYWTTAEDEFGVPNHQKQTSKRGCVAEVTGVLKVYVKSNKTTWKPLGKFKAKKEYIVAKPKLKKWKSVQLKFESDEYFRLYSTTLEAYLGSYIKR